MMLAAAPPLVTMPWIRALGFICWRSMLTLLKVWMTASSALTPSHGSAAACAALPVNSNATRTMPSRSWWRIHWSQPWHIIADDAEQVLVEDPLVPAVAHHRGVDVAEHAGP